MGWRLFVKRLNIFVNISGVNKKSVPNTLLLKDYKVHFGEHRLSHVYPHKVMHFAVESSLQT